MLSGCQHTCWCAPRDQPEDSTEDKGKITLTDILIEQRKMYWTRITVRGMFVAVAGSVASADFTGALLVWTPELLSRQNLTTIIVLPFY
jgi:hypothetical protein